MKIVFKILSTFLLLMTGAVSAHANQGQRQEWHDDARTIQHQQVFEERVQAKSEQAQVGERRRTKESGGFVVSGQDAQGNTAPEESSRKPGRMTPEERRALRRQINEAGRDIYAPTR